MVEHRIWPSPAPFFWGQNLEDLKHNRCDHETFLKVDPLILFMRLVNAKDFSTFHITVTADFSSSVGNENSSIVDIVDVEAGNRNQALFMFGIFTKATRTIAFGTSHPNKESLRSKFSQLLGCSTVAKLASRNKMDIL